MKIIIIDPRTRCPHVPKRGAHIPGPPIRGDAWSKGQRDQKHSNRKATKLQRSRAGDSPSFETDQTDG
jgi:hypothetical protein